MLTGVRQLFRLHISKLDLIFYNLSDLEEAGD